MRLAVSVSAVNCLQALISIMTCCMLSEILDHAHLLTQSKWLIYATLFNAYNSSVNKLTSTSVNCFHYTYNVLLNCDGKQHYLLICYVSNMYSSHFHTYTTQK